MSRTCCYEDNIALDQLVSGAGLTRMWNAIEWKNIRNEVFQMQCSIARAAQDSRLPDITQLQDELVSSLEVKSLAVKEITHKKSRDTPGIDGVLWKTPAEKMYAAYHLTDPGYHTSPVRRIYVPKDKPGKFRPLGIATMRDRAVQKLHAFALQPVAETWGDSGSFGYRLFRSAKDACSAIRSYLTRTGSSIWVLRADITECFDRISHEWLLDHIPMNKSYLAQVLTAGYLHHGRFFPVSRGVPQGGILSPLLANMTLDGLETVLMEREINPSQRAMGESGYNLSERLYVRYADDIVFMAPSRFIVDEARESTGTFLNERGLTLSAEKTRIVPIEEGFTFLHWHFRRRGARVRVSPSRSSIRNMERKITSIFQQHSEKCPEDLICQLNPLLRSFAYYHREGDAQPCFAQLDVFVQDAFNQLVPSWSRNHHDSGLVHQSGAYLSPGFRGSPPEREKLLLLSAIPERITTSVVSGKNPYLDRSLITQTFNGKDTLYKAVARDRKRQKRGAARWRMDDYL